MSATIGRCLHCGAVLSQYREAGETLCAPCSRTAADSAPTLRVLETEDLTYAVAAILLLARGLSPGQSVYIRDKLQAVGVEADHFAIANAVRKLERRYGMRIGAVAPQCGHRLDRWPHWGLLASAYQRLAREDRP